MGLFSIFKNSNTPISTQLNISIDAPASINLNQEVISAGATITAGTEAARISSVYMQLIEQYDRHTEDYQQTADNFHEVKAEAQESESFLLKPHESHTIYLQLEISGLRQKNDEVIQDNSAKNQSVTKILHTGPVVANVLRLGDNKENVHYIIKTTVEANGKLVSPPVTRISLQR